MSTIAAIPAGLVFGSFLSVLAYRVPRGMPWAAGRSRCPGCDAEVAAYDNVPVISWLWLRGRCRSCGERIPLRYPLAELALAGLFAGTVAILGTGDPAQLALGLVLCTLLVGVTITDLDLRVIPNRFLLAGALAGLGIVAVADPASLPERLLAAALAGGLLFAVSIAYPRGMGMGDAKLVAVLGLFLGKAVAPALLVGFAAGAAAGVSMMLAQGAGARRRTIPFGPFLALGGVVGLWAGPELVQWYLDSFVRGG